MEKTKTFMKKSYETLNMTPLGVEPAEDILLTGSITAQKGLVTVHPYEEGFIGDDVTGDVTRIGDKAFSDISF